MSEISALDQIRKLLATITSPPQNAATAKKIARLLREVERELGRSRTIVRKPKRGLAPVVYSVTVTGLGESLTEYRPESTSNAFRCPRPLYDAVVDVLVKADGPLTTDQIISEIERRTGVRPADHQYRVPLRLWMHVTPPLITRSRARYSPVNRKTFQNEVATVWSSLKTR